jgi:hypothetical protein
LPGLTAAGVVGFAALPALLPFTDPGAAVLRLLALLADVLAAGTGRGIVDNRGDEDTAKQEGEQRLAARACVSENTGKAVEVGCIHVAMLS